MKLIVYTVYRYNSITNNRKTCKLNSKNSQKNKILYNYMGRLLERETNETVFIL